MKNESRLNCGPSRGQVLGGLAMAAAPLVIPARLLGQNSPSNRVNLLMLGTGRQAYHANLSTLLGMPEVNVVAVCDVDRKRLEWNPETEQFTNDPAANKKLVGTYRSPWKI